INPEEVSSGRDTVDVARNAFAKAQSLPAPLRAIEAVSGSLTRSFAAASARARELFADCVVSPESGSLRHLFFAEREAVKPQGIPADTATLPIRRAAVLGAGTMGTGIAMCYANAGIPVL